VKRAIIIVLDGCGAGVAPDAPDFDDHDDPSTLRHVWDAVGGFNAPNLARIGYLAAGGIGDAPEGRYARLQPMSLGGKDSVTGHWEMMGIQVDDPFPTYPHGFPDHLVDQFEKAIGRSVLGNRPASGTQIIDELGELHMDSGFPILYTSADSVFQIAAHEKIVPIEQLYDWCLLAREICHRPNHVQRVIARPFLGMPGEFRRTTRRVDYPLPPPHNLADDVGDVYGVGVVPQLFGGRGFRDTPRTQSNEQHIKALLEALKSDARLIFANFEDFDMLYGHRNDPAGFARCLEEFDVMLGEIFRNLVHDDLLILTADHGNDPTSKSTDHSREYVPFTLNYSLMKKENLGDIQGFSAVGAAAAAHIGVPFKREADAILSPAKT
jgi:phosphopentomutase